MIMRANAPLYGVMRTAEIVIVVVIGISGICYQMLPNQDEDQLVLNGFLGSPFHFGEKPLT